MDNPSVSSILISYFRLVASAVIIPETVDSLALESPSKRGQIDVSDESSKRPRLVRDSSDYREVIATSTSVQTRVSVQQRVKGAVEERQRGKRLFGALLGTLSQSSSTTAQKRRLDIERKQQEKLKLQTQEYDEDKKQRLNALEDTRQQEQIKYDKQSVCYCNV